LPRWFNFCKGFSRIVFQEVFVKVTLSVISAFVVLSYSLLAKADDIPPAIKFLNDKFIAAHMPSEQELQFGRTWMCKSYSPWASNQECNDKEPVGRYNFSSFGGVIENDGDTSGLINESCSDGPLQTTSFSYVNGELVGLAPGGYHVFIRITDGGDLIVQEASQEGPLLQSPLTPDISPGTLGGYIACPQRLIQ